MGDAFGSGLPVLRDPSRIRVSAFGGIPIAGYARHSTTNVWKHQ